MNRHDCPRARIAVLRAMLRHPHLWLDTVSIGMCGIGTRNARVELRALRREWLVKRCDRGRWCLRDPKWAEEEVRQADATAQFHRDRLAKKAEEVRIGTASLALPQVQSCVEKTWAELMSGQPIFRK